MILRTSSRAETSVPAAVRIDNPGRRHDIFSRRRECIEPNFRLGKRQRSQQRIPRLLIRCVADEIDLNLLAIALVGGEEEKLVAKNRAAERAAVLIESSDRLGRRREKRPGVQLEVLEVVEPCAVDGV